MQRDQFPCEVSVREEQIGAKRICRKCLTADMDEKAYTIMVKVCIHISRIWMPISR